MIPPSILRARARKLFLVVACLALPGAALAGRTVTITHPPTTAPTYIDLGAPGASVGDVRIFSFDAKAADGTTVRTDWVMTTTAIDQPRPGLESRVISGVLSFGADFRDQVLLQGVAAYPGTDPTLKVASTTVRAIMGGTGKYAGARGWVESQHLADGSWKHVLHLQ